MLFHVSPLKMKVMMIGLWIWKVVVEGGGGLGCESRGGYGCGCREEREESYFPLQNSDDELMRNKYFQIGHIHYYYTAFNHWVISAPLGSSLTNNQ